MEVPGPDAYMPHALHLGLVSTDPSVVLTADSFQAVRTKARHLAILCGFQIRMAKGGSNRRRGWLCGSADGCPFSIFAHRNKRGIQIRANLAHNHAFHLPQDQGKRFTTATTEEVRMSSAIRFPPLVTNSCIPFVCMQLACYVRQSAIYQQSTNINKLTGKQISDAIFAHTGRHVKANRASVIKKLLVHHPERVPLPILPTDSFNSPVKSMAEAVWDCFVYIANSPWTIEHLGVARVRHMVAVFKQDRDTLRATLLMTCPRHQVLPCLSTNPPNVKQFVEQYLRQTELGFF
ncbi:hypothetical protein DYB32_003805 [Aphanomyces invadans]|uniref:Uncharacterized protein n=1 Tax=Aphanomyces invadans TaxID=157072 RepID=A0A3R6VZ02_9STRA|nr:hypothetical protein DYB32_003805 [Aphanomyces invadans]